MYTVYKKKILKKVHENIKTIKIKYKMQPQ